MRLAAANNAIRFNTDDYPPYATKVGVTSDGTLFLDVEGALSDRRNEVEVKGRVVLAATQKVGPLVGSGTITSATGATWDFCQRTFTSEYPLVQGSTTNTVVFADTVNVKKSGAHAVYFGGISTSSGELQVAEGTVGFCDKGSWLTCPAVRVSANAVLEPSRRCFGKSTTFVYLEKGAKVRLPKGNAFCAGLYLDGVLQAEGKYTKENCAEYVEGDGNLWAGRAPGMFITIR